MALRARTAYWLASLPHRPGPQATPPERSEGLERAARRARQAGKGLFEYRACATCRQVDEKAQSVFGWDIVPVRIARTWYPLARFDHSRHATMACADCHGFRPPPPGQASDAT